MKVLTLSLIPLILLLNGCINVQAVMQAEADKRNERIHALANAGNAEAQYHVGMFFNNGMNGMKQDAKIAFDWFQKAQAGGNPLGAYKVGCYYAGQFPGTVVVDEEKALSNKLIAANAGYAIAQHEVGNIYDHRKDFRAAEQWWKRAGDQGFSPSHQALHTLYASDHAGLSDPAMAYARMKLASRNLKKEISPHVRDRLAKLASELPPTALDAAEKFVDAFVPVPTPLTRDAMNMRRRINTLLTEAEGARKAAREAKLKPAANVSQTQSDGRLE